METERAAAVECGPDLARPPVCHMTSSVCLSPVSLCADSKQDLNLALFFSSILTLFNVCQNLEVSGQNQSIGQN